MSNSEVAPKISELLDSSKPYGKYSWHPNNEGPHLSLGNSVWVNSMGASVTGLSMSLHDRGSGRFLRMVYRSKTSRRRSTGVFDDVTCI